MDGYNVTKRRGHLVASAPRWMATTREFGSPKAAYMQAGLPPPILRQHRARLDVSFAEPGKHRRPPD
jgi:hypothetical protein